MSIKVSASIPLLGIDGKDQPAVGAPRMTLHSWLHHEIEIEVEGHRYRVDVRELRAACAAVTIKEHKYLESP